MDAGKIIRRQVRVLEADAELVHELREHAKTDGGRLTEFGREIIASGKTSGLKQAFFARLLDISPGAISQHYAK